MAREDIEKMIADALGAAEKSRDLAARRPLPHAQHILDQYAALCRTGERKEVEPSGRVELPVTAVDSAASPARPNRLCSLLKRVLGRVKIHG